MATYKKHFRTPHLPYSESVADDDIVRDESHFDGVEVVVSLKMDGECTRLYHDYCHARSIDSDNHPSRDYVKKWWMERSYLLPENMAISGENVYAEHSIFYDDLKHYFYGFMATINDTYLSWDETIEWFALLDITPVDVIYRGVYDKKAIMNAFKPFKEKHEGFVCRVAGSFQYEDSSKSVAKYVRKGHVQTTTHWMNKPVVPNKLKEK